MSKYSEKNFVMPSFKEKNNIEDMLSENEEVLWRDKPNRKAFILSKIFTMLPLVILWLIVDVGIITFMAVKGIFSQMSWWLVLIIVLFFLIHLTPFWIWISNIVTSSIQQKNMEYALTNRRIIIRTGIFIDVQNIYYADIVSVNLKVGLIDKMCHVGDIYIVSKFGSHVLFDINNPYGVVSNLQKIVQDIKNDIYFPNELRPKTNSGYSTNYTGNNNDINKN